ncbi:hypothetical protein [Roseateles sp.]|uniref:hypothetical protein n=1 Tax=Roseateles sp. TaxID=1971397 RepID=UPI0031E29AC1
MDRYQGQAAAWAAPLFSHLHAVANDGKRTHKLPQLACVLWLPDYGAYLRSLNLFECSFTTSPNADGAMRLGEDQAVAVGRDFIATTGVRVRVRPYHSTH